MMADRPPAPRLMLVTDAARSRLPLVELVREAAAGGVDAIYLRDRELSDADLASLAKSLGLGVALLINGGLDRARAVGAGLHLRERDQLPGDARTALDADVLIGRSVHSVDEARSSAGADYLLAGHVYPSASKPGQEPLGLERFAAIADAAQCPVLAIGGITCERIPDVVRAGAHGVAVIGAIVEARDPRAAAFALRTALDRALHERWENRDMPEQHVTKASEIDIVVNGKRVTVAAGDTVHDFLARKRMTDAMAIVERNGEIVPRPAYATTLLTPGDQLEVVHAVGGG